GFELAVLAFANHPEQMAGLAVAYDGAVLNGPGFGALVSLPTFERLAVKHVDPAFLGGRKERRTSQRRNDQGNLLHVTIIAPSGSGWALAAGKRCDRIQRWKERHPGAGRVDPS